MWLKVRKIPSPWFWALILGVFVKVRKTPPLILRTLNHHSVLGHQVRKTPPWVLRT